MDRILLTGMRFEGHHGVSADERASPQLLEVDLDVEADLSAAGRSDALSDTIDYARLVEVARRVVEDERCHLLEAIAERVCAGVLASASGASAVTVRVRKLAVPLEVDMDHAAVELRRVRPPA